MAPAAAPIRIAQVATAASSVQALLSGQIRALQQAGAAVTAVCAPGPEVPGLRCAGIPVVPVPMARQPAPLRDCTSLWRLRRVLAAGQFDAVISHTPKAGLIGPVAARLAGVPAVIHTVHGLLFHDRTPPGRARLLRAAERWTARWAGWLWFQSREDLATAERLGLAPAGRLRYVGNGIDLSRFDPQRAPPPAAARLALGLPPGGPVVGTVARLVYEKGLGEFLAAAELLLARFPELRFLVVGPAEPGRRDAVPESRIRALAATGRFVFPGQQADMPAVYRCMDVFVLPSHREGIPRAVMEAAAMELPVVASDIRGCREVVRHGETGLLAPVRDAAAVAHAVAQILTGGQGPRLAAAGRALIRAEYDEALVHRRIIAGLEEILHRPLGPPGG